ncbi:unnamed protein product [Closterium sp. NIES-53]
MDVWGPTPIGGTDQERHFLLVVDDYTRYTTVFPLRHKADVSGVLIPWIHATRRQLRERFRQDFSVLRLHSDRGGEFSSDLLAEFCRDEGIHQTFTLLASPQKNGFAKRCIGLIMEVACTSMIHAAAPHFLWPFAIQYTAHQLNLWPCVSEPETLPTLRWTGKVGDVSVFRVLGTLSLVRDAKASKLSSSTLRCVFLGFPIDAPPWQFYHPQERQVFSSQDVTFDESVCFYRLHPHVSHPVPLVPLFLVPVPPPSVDSLPPQGPAPLGVSQVDPPPLIEPLEISSDSSGPAEGGDPVADDTAATRRSPRLETPLGFPPRLSSPPPQPAAVDFGAEPGGAEREGEGSGGAATGGVATGGAGSGGAVTGGVGSGGADSGADASPIGGGAVGNPTGGHGAGQPPQPDLLETLSPQAISAWIIRRGNPGGGGYGPAGAGAASPGGTASAGGTGGTVGGAAGAGGTRGAAGGGGAGATSPRGATSAGGVGPTSPGGTAGAGGAGAAGPGGARTGGARAAGASGAVSAGGAEGTRAAGTGGAGATGAGAAGAAGPRGARTRGTGVAEAGGAASGGDATGATSTGGAGAAGAGGAGAGGAGAAGPRGARTGGAGAARAGGAVSAGGATGAAGSGGAGGTASAGGVGAGGIGGIGGTGGAGAAGPGGARTRGAGATGAGGAAGARGAGGATGAAGIGGARGTAGARGAGAAGARGAAGAEGARGADGAAGAGGAGAAGAGGAGAASSAQRRLFFYQQPQSSLPPPDSVLLQVLNLPSSTGLTPPLLCSQTDQSQPQLLHGSSLPAPTPQTEVTESLTERREPENRASTPVRARRVACPRPPAVLGTHGMALRPSSIPQRVVLPEPPASSLLHVTDPESDLARAGSGSDSWRSTRSSSVLSSSSEAEIYAGAMAAQELRWLTYLLTDLGEWPRSPLVLYVNNKAMLALCHEQRLEHRTKHIALCYFLARELQQHRQIRLSYVASQASTADVFTKALGSGDHQRFCTALGLVPILPHLLVA